MKTKLMSKSIVLTLLVFTIALPPNYGIQAATSTDSFPTWAQNDSYSTSCPEKDNINIPLFSQEAIE